MGNKGLYHYSNFQWRNVIFFAVTPFIGLILLYLHIKYEGMNYYLLIPGLIMYILTNVSITGGYHRLFSHRAYRANKLVKAFYLLFGAAAFQETALKWATDHRRHHHKVDTDEDPYTINKGFFYAHIGWIFLKEEDQYKDKYEKDLLNDPLVMWQFRNYILIGSIVGFIFPLFIGFTMGSPIGGLAIAGVLRMMLLHHSTFLINSACHYWGKQPYTDKNTAKDSFIMAVLTMGEGYHNFHHYFQADYRNGIKWNHWDPTKWLIKFFSIIKFADRLVVTPELEITKAKLRMDRLRLEKSIAVRHLPSLDEMREKVQRAQKQLQALKVEYKRLKEKSLDDKKQQINELKINIKLAQIEFQNQYTQWKYFIKSCPSMA